MIQPEQLQKDIAALPETAQVLVADFVAFLKQRYTPAPTSPVPTPPIADMEHRKGKCSRSSKHEKCC